MDMEIIVVLWGLVLGSFLNVVIYRLPRHRSVVSPRSFCPHCGEMVKFYHNIPLLSYLWLGGKCAACRKPISLQYPLVEVITALSWFLVYRFWSDQPLHLVFSGFFLSLLIALAFIDLNHQILPDELTIGGSVLFFLYSFIAPSHHPSPLEGLLSGLGGGLIFLGIYYFYLKVRKIEGLGLGDIKFIVLLGIFLGIEPLVITILLASVSGLLVGIFFILFKQKTLKFMLPFGTFLSLGAFGAYFFSSPILNFIQHLFYGA